MLLDVRTKFLAIGIAMAGCAVPVGAGVTGADDDPTVGPRDGQDARDAAPAEAPEPSREDAGVATDASTEPPEDAAEPAPCDFHTVIAPCGRCHSLPINAAHLDLISPDLEARLIDVPAESTPCGSGKLVDVDQPAESALYLKITRGECGFAVAHVRGAAMQECVLGWIESL